MAHVLLIFILLWQPILLNKLVDKIRNKYYQYQKNRDYDALTQGRIMTVTQEIELTFLPWQPQKKIKDTSGLTFVNQTPFTDLSVAVKSLQHGDTLLIAEGTYQIPIVIKKNNITIKGNGYVIFEKSAAHSKGYILSQGDNLTVENIECRYIRVRDGNGACIRQEGKDLTLNHVYFHNSQEGILETSKNAGFIKIFNSRFERLGHNGQAHGVYTNKAELFIYQSLFIATKSEGHAIKVRGKKLTIDKSIIVSLSAVDSRLIDMPNGGEMVVRASILAQGPNSSNGQVIGLGLEGVTHEKNSILLSDNLIYLERIGVNKFLTIAPELHKSISVTQNRNIVIGDGGIENEVESNSYFQSRKELGLPNYPKLSKSFCLKNIVCVIR